MRHRHACFGGDPVAADADDFGPLLAELALIGDADELEYRVSQLPGPVQRRLLDAFGWQRHRGQEEPAGDWRVWLAMAGRGFGKTKLRADAMVWALSELMLEPQRPMPRVRVL